MDGGGEHDAAPLLQADEGVAPGRYVGAEIRAGDRDQAPAIGEPRERGCEMAIGCVGDTPLDIGEDREWRVHHHDCWDGRRVEMIVDLGCVEAGHGNGRKEGGDECGPGFGEFVEDKRAAGDLGEDGEQAGAGRWFEHAIGGCDGGRSDRGQAERDRRRELLEGLRLLGAARVGGQKSRDLAEQRNRRSRRPGFAQKRLSVFAEHEDGCGFAGVIGVLPVPGAGSIGRAEGGLHGGAQDRGVDALAALDVRKEEKCRGMDGGSVGRLIGGGRQRRRKGVSIHGRRPRESGAGKPAGALSRTGRAQTRPGLPLALKGRGPAAPSSDRQWSR
ncbi:hypothetical protein BN961_03709 [Afipia felis]|uniref:Uncharacterized protein n=1 Tax=Afipia felis TaxID=1035 RepID=A0A090MSG9_AFIFE|nr:hypothetical protein BN961_03709 [Afipia felis]